VAAPSRVTGALKAVDAIYAIAVETGVVVAIIYIFLTHKTPVTRSTITSIAVHFVDAGCPILARIGKAFVYILITDKTGPPRSTVATKIDESVFTGGVVLARVRVAAVVHPNKNE